jgi:hypothetical protein
MMSKARMGRLLKRYESIGVSSRCGDGHVMMRTTGRNGCQPRVCCICLAFERPSQGTDSFDKAVLRLLIHFSLFIYPVQLLTYLCFIHFLAVCISLCPCCPAITSNNILLLLS